MVKLSHCPGKVSNIATAILIHSHRSIAHEWLVLDISTCLILRVQEKCEEGLSLIVISCKDKMKEEGINIINPKDFYINYFGGNCFVFPAHLQYIP